jgi:excisionase family DNA binding protein
MPVRDETGEEMLTPEEAAQELGLSRSTLRVQTKRGRLRTKKLSERVVLYPRSAIEEYKRERLGQPPGVKRRKGSEDDAVR